MINTQIKRNNIQYLPIFIVAVVIIVSGILTKQHVIGIIPMVVSLVVVMLNSKLYRFAFIVGAINSAIYAVGFYMLGLYGSLVSALLVSMPLQIASFFLWKKKHINIPPFLKN